VDCTLSSHNCQGDLYRDSNVNYELTTHALYAQDTYSLGKTTFTLGVRWDQQDNIAEASSVPGHPFVPDWLPAVAFPGADAGVVWNDISPRLGVTYDLMGTGKTVIKASYALYYGQRSPNQVVNTLNPVTAVQIRFPWTDLNGDMFVTRDELNLGVRPTVVTGNYDPDNPTSLRSSGTVDPDVKNDRTREFIAGFDHEVMANLAVGASYIYRKYDRFTWDDKVGLTSANYVERTFTPSAASCPAAGARCDTVTFFEPNIPVPGAFVFTNVPDRYRDYNGVELSLNKRYSNKWMGLVSFAFNDATDHWDSPNSFEDPTCRAGSGTAVNTTCLPSQAYAPESGGSGIDNIFNNAEWMFKAQGMYTLPWDINVAGFFQSRQGYPFPQAVRIASRANQGGLVDVLLEPLGDTRHPTLNYADFKVEKAFTFGTTRIIPSLDIFNIGNVNTVLARRRLQAAANANQISGIVAPRVLRFGVRINW
jgi:hypothetical protein